MSCGLIKFNGSPPPVLELSKGKPSTTKRGVLPVLIPPGPLTVIPILAPGSPLEEVTVTPETLPCKSSWGVLTIPLLKASLFNDFTAPVTSFFLCVPYPITATSASTTEVAASVNEYEEAEVTFTSAVSKETALKTSTSPSFAEIIKEPFSDVIAETWLPLTTTVTEATGLPFASFTVPLICLCCA